MLDLGITLDYTGFLEAYEQRKDLLLDYIHSKAVSPADISELDDLFETGRLRTVVAHLGALAAEPA